MMTTEQALMVMLQQLPISITITWQNNRYHWQCAQGNGSSPDLVEAAGQALRYLFVFLATDTRKDRVTGGLHDHSEAGIG